MTPNRLAVASLLVLLPALASSSASSSAFAQAEFDAAAREYEQGLRLRSLFRRALSMEAFAATRDARAFKALGKRYARPDAPALHVRYLLGTIFRGALGNRDADACTDVLDRLVKKNKAPTDAWLHRCVYGIHAKADPTRLLGIAGDKRQKPYVRVAALLALAEVQDDDLLATIPTLLDEDLLPRRGRGRLLLLEACARALTAYRGRGRDALRPAARAVIGLLGHGQTSERTKVVVSRYLKSALKTSRPAFDEAGWLAILNGADDQGAGQTRTRASFFSVQSAGRNVAYVLDLSDSMLEPLGEAEARRLAAAMPEAAGQGVFAKNRFEATKVLLASSLRALEPSMAFAVIVFGSAAELMTPGMLKATPANVEKAIQRVDALPVGPADEDRPHGTLKGWTNLYGGLRLAFKVTRSGARQADDEYVAEACFQGCDTIFLLSDGEPTWSDFEGWDLARDEDVVGDGEGDGGTSSAQGEEIQYYGPQFLERFLFADLERLNMFRNVQIHSIGIGEADPKLLEALAKIGGGTARFFGGE